MSLAVSIGSSPYKSLLSFVSIVVTRYSLHIETSRLGHARMEYPRRVGPPSGEVAPVVVSTMKAIVSPRVLLLLHRFLTNQRRSLTFQSKRRPSSTLSSLWLCQSSENRQYSCCTTYNSSSPAIPRPQRFAHHTSCSLCSSNMTFSSRQLLLRRLCRPVRQQHLRCDLGTSSQGGFTSMALHHLAHRHGIF